MTITTDRKSSDISTLTIGDDTSVVSVEDECSIKCRSSTKVVMFVATILKVFTLISASTTILYGGLIVTDQRLTSPEADGLFRLIYFSSISFSYIIRVVYSVLLIIGILSALVSLLGLLDCLCTKQLFKRKKVFSGILTLSTILKIILIIVWALSFQKVKREVTHQMKVLFRHFYWLAPQWNAFQVKFSCCGVDTNTGIYEHVITDDVRIQWVIPDHVPQSCCSGNNVPDNDFFFTSDCPLSIKEPCIGPFMVHIERYRIPVLCVLCLAAILEICAIITTLYEIRKIRSLLDEQQETNNGDNNTLCERFTTTKVMSMAFCIMCIIPSAVLTILGIVFCYDEIFSHPLIRELWSGIEFKNSNLHTTMTFTSVATITKGIAMISFSLVGISFLRQSSVKFVKMFLGLIVIQLIITWVNVAWWIVFVQGIEDLIQRKLRNILQHTFTSMENHKSYSFSMEGAWNNLFARTECCGIESIKDFHAITSNQILGPVLANIPVYCCTTNPFSELYHGQDTKCTVNLEKDLRFNTSCSIKLLSRFRWYSTTFFVASVILLALLKTLVILSVIEMKNAGVCFKEKPLPRRRRIKSMRRVSRVGSVMYGPTYRQPPSKPAWRSNSIFQCLSPQTDHGYS